MSKTYSILVLPYEETANSLNDVLSRLSWYFSYEVNIRFIIKTNLPFPLQLTSENHFSNLDSPYQNIFPHLESTQEEVNNLEYDFLLNLGKKKLNKNKEYFANPEEVIQDSQVYIKILNLITSDRIEENLRTSLLTLNKFNNKNEFKIANLFATGPNLDEIFAGDFSITSGLNIICNSLILHERFLTKVHPHILVFADPIFHFGPSSYTESFIKSLKRFCVSYPDCLLVIPLQYSEIFKKHFQIKNKVIFMPSFLLDEPNFNVNEFFGVKITNNILTYLMLPIATSFCPHILFYGFDGQQEVSSKYFWNHNKNAQINDKMAAIQKAHPAFFSISYPGYYKNHCRLLKSYLTYAYKKGYTFHTKTKSYIPCLVERYFKTTFKEKITPKENDQYFISLLPNMKSGYGHHLAHEEEINKYIPVGAEHFLLSHNDFDSALTKLPTIKTYSKAVWEIKSAKDKEVFLLETINAFENILSNVKNIHSKFYVTLYSGSETLIDQFLRLDYIYGDRISFHINLFYINSTLFDKNGLLTLKLPAPFFRKLQASTEYSKNLFLYCDNSKLRDFLGVCFNINLNSWPHFSSTILPTFTLNEQPTTELVMYYPSYILADRGINNFLDNLVHVRSFLEEQKIHVILRRVDVSENKHNISSIEKTLGFPDFIKYIDGELSSEMYGQLFVDADIILIPYPVQYFRFRTSAVLIDAIRAKKPVLSCKGTWAGDMTEKNNIGTTYIENDPISFEKALKKLIEEYSSFKKNLESLEQESFSTAKDLIKNITSSSKKNSAVSLKMHLSYFTRTNSFYKFERFNTFKEIVIDHLTMNNFKDIFRKVFKLCFRKLKAVLKLL